MKFRKGQIWQTDTSDTEYQILAIDNHCAFPVVAHYLDQGVSATRRYSLEGFLMCGGDSEKRLNLTRLVKDTEEWAGTLSDNTPVGPAATREALLIEARHLMLEMRELGEEQIHVNFWRQHDIPLSNFFPTVKEIFEIACDNLSAEGQEEGRERLERALGKLGPSGLDGLQRLTHTLLQNFADRNFGYAGTRRTEAHEEIWLEDE